MASTYPAETDANGDVTSFLPLTSIFIPPASCSTIFRLNGPSLVAYDPGYGLDIDPSVLCQPDAITTWWEQDRLALGINADEHTVISLGPMACPSGWTTVEESTKDIISTLAMCCPPDFTLRNRFGGSIAGECISSVYQDDVLTYASTSFGAPNHWSITTETIEVPSFVGAVAVLGWNIQITASETSSLMPTKSSSLTSDSPSTADGYSNPTTKAGTTTAETGATSNASNVQPVNSGVPLATSVGVSVAVVIVVLLFAALGYYLVKRRKRQKAASRIPELPALPILPALPEHQVQQTEPTPHASDKSYIADGWTIPATPISELSAGNHISRPVELPVP